MPKRAPRTIPVVRVILIAGLAAVTAGAPARGASVDFEKDVVPILRAKCYECHTGKKAETDKKPKADLALDSPAGILAGKILEAGKPDESPLYFRTVLPASDDDVMPPADENKPVTQAEAETLKAWIAAGAHFGKAGGAAAGPVKVLSLDEVKSMGLRDPDPDAVRALTDLGATVTPVAVTTPQLLAVEFISNYKLVGDEEVKQLMGIAPNIMELNLARTNTTDEGLKYVGAFARLAKLNLNNTKIGDAGLAHLTGLTQLDWLNLYGTQISDEGLPHIAKLRNLKAVYLWNSKVTPEGVEKLRKALGSTKVVDKVWSESSRFDLKDL